MTETKEAETKKRKVPFIRDNPPEEEAEIQRQIAADPDTWSVPLDAPVLKRGRPEMNPQARKQQVTLRLDKDLVERLKESGKGWQTRLNALLRSSLNM